MKQPADPGSRPRFPVRSRPAGVSGDREGFGGGRRREEDSAGGIGAPISTIPRRSCNRSSSWPGSPGPARVIWRNRQSWKSRTVPASSKREPRQTRALLSSRASRCSMARPLRRSPTNPITTPSFGPRSRLLLRLPRRLSWLSLRAPDRPGRRILGFSRRSRRNPSP